MNRWIAVVVVAAPLACGSGNFRARVGAACQTPEGCEQVEREAERRNADCRGGCAEEAALLNEIKLRRAEFARGDGGAAATATRTPSAASKALSEPLTTQCQKAKLQKCDVLFDGVVDVIDGHRADAEPKLREAIAANPPERVKSFAETMKTIGSLPFLSSYGGPLRDAAELLTSDGLRASAASAASQPCAGAPRCIPNQQSPCACESGASGFQECAGDGLSFSKCRCAK